MNTNQCINKTTMIEHIYDITQCQICMNKYNDSRSIVCLACKHNFCNICMNDICANKCPICNAHIVIINTPIGYINSIDIINKLCVDANNNDIELVKLKHNNTHMNEKISFKEQEQLSLRTMKNYDIGEFYFNNNKYKESIQYYNKCIEDSENVFDAKLCLLFVYGILKDMDNYSKIKDTIDFNSSNNPEIEYYKIGLLVDEGKYQICYDILLKHVNILDFKQTNEITVLLNRFSLYLICVCVLGLNKYMEGEFYTERLLEYDNKYATTSYNQTIEAVRFYVECKIKLKKSTNALKIIPSYIDKGYRLEYEMGLLYYNIGDYENAIKYAKLDISNNVRSNDSIQLIFMCCYYINDIAVIHTYMPLLNIVHDTSIKGKIYDIIGSMYYSNDVFDMAYKCITTAVQCGCVNNISILTYISEHIFHNHT